MRKFINPLTRRRFLCLDVRSTLAVESTPCGSTSKDQALGRPAVPKSKQLETVLRNLSCTDLFWSLLQLLQQKSVVTKL